MCKKLMFLVSLVAVLSLAGTAQANNLLQNPGFETGVEAPWYNYTESGGTTAVMSGDAHSGDYWWQVTSGDAFISGLQDIGVPPVPVTISAYLRNSGASAVDIELGFDYSPDPMAAPWWYGQSVRGITIPADNAWALYSFTEFDTLAPGYVTDPALTSRPTESYIMKVKIALTTPSSTLDVDDASAVPEPATLVLLGLGTLTALRRRRHQ